MIVSNLPPSFLLGSLATAIRTRAFHCFVGTTRNGRFLNRWATFILDGDPSLDKRWKLCGSFRYPRGTGKAARLAAHRELADRLDAMGERGMGLTLALESIFHDLEVRGIIEPAVMDDSAKHPPLTTSLYQKTLGLALRVESGFARCVLRPYFNPLLCCFRRRL